MENDILEQTYQLLEADPRTIGEIAEQSGLNYHWLGKFKQRKFSDPGFKKISTLHAFLIAGVDQAGENRGHSSEVA